jgi:hypothetical protein
LNGNRSNGGFPTETALTRKPKPPDGPKTKKPPSELSIADLLGSLGPEDRERLRAALMAKITAEVEMLDLVEDLFQRLEAPGNHEIAADEALIDEVVSGLAQLGVESNGGDPEARKAAAAVLEKLDAALAADRFDAASIVLIAKILGDARWVVPTSLQNKLVDALDAAPLAQPSEFDLKTALRQIADAAGDDAFAAYEALNSVLAAFPSDAAARMVGVLSAGRAPVLLHTLAGFVLHADSALALAAVAALKVAAAAQPIESALVERLVRMRPWLTSDRQGPLDEAIRGLRAHALPPRDIERLKPVKGFVMACDGMGAAGTLATLKGPRIWSFAAAMTGPGGVVDVIGLERSRKADVDATVRGLRENVVTAETDAAGVGHYLQLCLGEGLEARNAPPFRLVGFVESLGLGTLMPRALSPGDLVAEILAGDEDVSPQVLAQAHQEAARSKLVASWFEAGEAIERLLKPVRGAKARARAVLGGHLPARRAFWARVCAMSAFALALDAQAYPGLGRSLALVGRDVAAGKPLEDMPLMRRIAETTVFAFEDRA